jgi:hypothetical protein
MGDMLRILAHGGMSMGTQALGQYLGNVFAGDRAMDLEILKEKFKTLANARPDAAQAIAGSIEQSRPGSMALMPKVQGYAPPGLEPSAAESNPVDRLLSTQTSPNVFQSLQDALPVTRGETTLPMPSTTFATAAPKLEQQVANEVAGRGGSPLATLSHLKRIDQPRGEFATLIEMSRSPDPVIAQAAQNKLNQPEILATAKKEAAEIKQAASEERMKQAHTHFEERMKLSQKLFDQGVEMSKLKGKSLDITNLDKMVDDLRTQRKDITALVVDKAKPEVVQGAIDTYNNTVKGYIQTEPKFKDHPAAQEHEAIIKPGGWITSDKAVGLRPKETIIPATIQSIPQGDPQKAMQEIERRKKAVGR